MLVSLQALRSHGLRLSINEENKLLKLEHVVNLINLSEVWMHVHDVRDLRRIEEGILAHLVNMRTLAISNDVEIIKHVDESDLPSLSEKMLAMKDLEILYLAHFAVPVWVCGFSNLVQLELRNCHCAHYPPLEMMPNLISLELSNNMNCSELPKGFGKPRGFPKLRHLQMSDFALLEELPELEDGAMPRLEKLQVNDCKRVKKVPHGLELLKSLKMCDFRMTGTYAFRNELMEGGEYRNKLNATNPNVTII